MVTAAGRIFSIMDEGPTASIYLPPKWFLTARDAFSGVLLWKVPIDQWHASLFPLKSGPLQLPRRLVAVGDRVLEAETIVVALGSINGTIKEVVDAMRDDGAAIGSISICAFRPFPLDELRAALINAKRDIILKHVNDDGTITYTPNENFNGTETFEYTAIDGVGG